MKKAWGVADSETSPHTLADEPDGLVGDDPPQDNANDTAINPKTNWTFFMTTLLKAGVHHPEFLTSTPLE